MKKILLVVFLCTAYASACFGVGTQQSTYQNKTTPVAADRLTGIDSVGNVTKNFLLSDLQTFMFGSDSVLFSVTAPLAFNNSTGVLSLDGTGCTSGQGIVWGGTSFACGTFGGGGSQAITISTSAPSGGSNHDIWYVVLP